MQKAELEQAIDHAVELAAVYEAVRTRRTGERDLAPFLSSERRQLDALISGYDEQLVRLAHVQAALRDCLRNHYRHREKDRA